MTYEKLRPTFTFTEDRIAELRAVVPEAFEDGILNWDTLRDSLGNWTIESDQDAEHFGLIWPGKREARRLAAKPSHGTLLPVSGEGINEKTTKNIFIEGDNLEALKLLQKSYVGRVKMIFIDPPYNTGNDFVYKDNFTEPLEDYLRRSNQASDEGDLLTSNPKSGGRFHTNWLNMMYPRLRLAKALLRDDGIIFVSIDDNEMHNLKAIMDEVFGEENFIANVVWQHSIQGKNDVQTISNHHNYIMFFGKSSSVEVARLVRNDEHNVNYSNPDNDPRGAWRSGDVRSPNYRENLRYDLITPSGKSIKAPPNGWRWDKGTLQQKVESGEIIFRNEETKIIRKIYLANQDGRVAESIWLGKDVGTTREASNELKNIFNGQSPFDTPKPTKLIEQLALLVGLGDGDIVVDFFSGSATTAHAILQMNRNDGKQRQFILIQIPEVTPNDSVAKKTGFHTVAEIGKDRIRRVLKQLQEQTELLLDEKPLDLGFKVYKLGPSHFKAWQDYNGNSLTDIQSLFDEFETPLVDGWEKNGLLTEVLLLEGFPLDSNVEPQPIFLDNSLFRVSSPTHGHRLWMCFDAKIMPSTLGVLNLPATDVFICLDSALDDNAKLHLSQAGTLRTI